MLRFLLSSVILIATHPLHADDAKPLDYRIELSTIRKGYAESSSPTRRRA